MHKLNILWIDLRIRRKQLLIPEAFSECSEIKVAGGIVAGDAVDGFKPDALCFDFDHPDMPSLRLMQDTKRTRPSLPLIMLTEQHSEELAIWAFRTGVWDYLVRPVAEVEAKRTVEGLVRMLACNHEQRLRVQKSFPPIPPEVRFPGAKPKDNSIQPALTYVQKNLGSRIREFEVASFCKMSPFTFSRAFKKAMDITFQEYVIRARITEACRLMENPNASITDIAFTVGFNDPSYFARMFKRYMGRSPSAYRQADMPGQPDDPGLWARLELPKEQIIN